MGFGSNSHQSRKPMQHWLFKTEPSDFSIDDLSRDRKTTWDGVSNAMARIHLRNVKKGDRIFIYHTGKEKSVVGIAKAAADADLQDKDVTVQVAFDTKFTSPVTLSTIRGRNEFAHWDLVRNSRLSVMPVSQEIWAEIMQLSGK